MIEDIEGLEKIEDFSIFFLTATTVFCIILVIYLIKLYKKRKNRPPTKEELALKGYTNIDFSNPKRASYLITKYGFILAKNEKSKEIYKELLNNISKYKYKKEGEPFDEESKKLYKLFLEVVTNE
jgi:hypothetical protein